MNWYVAGAIAASALVTVLLRALPFLAFGKSGKMPDFVSYLGKTLPYAMMAMLVVFCMKSTTFVEVKAWAPQFIAAVLVVISYVWKRSTILSIVLGTACYMVLIQQVF